MILRTVYPVVCAGAVAAALVALVAPVQADAADAAGPDSRPDSACVCPSSGAQDGQRHACIPGLRQLGERAFAA